MLVPKKREDLVVFILRRATSTCGECGTTLHKGNLIRLQGEKGALCMECADLDHLEFLPRGDAANHSSIDKILKTYAEHACLKHSGRVGRSAAAKLVQV